MAPTTTTSALGARELELYASLARSKAKGDAPAYQEAIKSSARELLAAGKHEAAKLVLEAGLEAPALDTDMYTLHIQSCLDTTPPKSLEALQAAQEMAQRAAAAQEPEVQVQAGLARAIAHMVAAREPGGGEGGEARAAHEAAALALLEQLAAQQPGHAGAQYHLALLLASLGRHDAAVAATKAALAAAAGQRAAVLQPCMALLALLLSARWAPAAGRPRPSRTCCCLRSWPCPPPCRADTPLPCPARRRGEHQAAAAVVAKALQAHPGGGSASSSNGHAASASAASGAAAAGAAPLGRHELLLLRLQAALLAAAGDGPGALQVLGGCRRRLAQDGRPGRAAQEAQVWRDMGPLYSAQGLHADAAQCAAQCAALQPHSADTHCALGAAREAAGDDAGAESCYGAALALGPSHAAAAIALGGRPAAAAHPGCARRRGWGGGQAPASSGGAAVAAVAVAAVEPALTACAPRRLAAPERWRHRAPGAGALAAGGGAGRRAAQPCRVARGRAAEGGGRRRGRGGGSAAARGGAGGHRAGAGVRRAPAAAVTQGCRLQAQQQPERRCACWDRPWVARGPHIVCGGGLSASSYCVWWRSFSDDENAGPSFRIPL
jgi:tetratricopeptide (TPR) repeat protein